MSAVESCARMQVVVSPLRRTPKVEALIDVMRCAGGVIFACLLHDRNSVVRLIIGLDFLRTTAILGGAVQRRALKAAADSPLTASKEPPPSSEVALDELAEEWSWHVQTAGIGLYAQGVRPVFGLDLMIQWQPFTHMAPRELQAYRSFALGRCLDRAERLLDGLSRLPMVLMIPRYRLFHETRVLARIFAHDSKRVLPQLFQTVTGSGSTPLPVCSDEHNCSLTVNLEHGLHFFDLTLAARDPFAKGTELHIDHRHRRGTITVGLESLLSSRALLREWGRLPSLLPRFAFEVMRELCLRSVDVYCEQLPINRDEELIERPVVLALFRAGFTPYLRLKNPEGRRHETYFERQHFDAPSLARPMWHFVFTFPFGKLFGNTHWRMWRLSVEDVDTIHALEAEPPVLRTGALHAIAPRERSDPFELAHAWAATVESST